jgi:uncharacterized protein (TIGR00730 family)
MRKLSSDSPTRKPAICVFCGSSHGVDPAYTEAAQRLGQLLTERGFELVFGGGGVGLMGEVAASVSQRGGAILGIIPSFLRHLEPPLEVKSKIVVTETMNDRKAKMFEASDGFAILPGGLGTLDEFFEALTNAQLHLHTKPIVLINTKNYYGPLLKLIDHIVVEGFAQSSVRDLIEIADTPEDAIRIFAARCVPA